MSNMNIPASAAAPQGAIPAQAPTDATLNPAAIPETPPPAPPAEEAAPKEDPKFAARFAALTRKEQAIRAREAAIKEQQAKYADFEATEKSIKADPLAYLQKRGITLEQLAQIALNDGKKPPEMRVQELEERLEREAKERQEQEQSSKEKAYQTQVEQFRTEISDHIKSSPEEYELLGLNEGSVDLIYQVIENHYGKTKRVLSVKDASDMVEKHFEQEAMEVLAKSKKLSGKMAPREEAAPAPAAKPAAPTLTNSQSSSVPTPSTKPTFSIEESKAQAAKLLKWT